MDRQTFYKKWYQRIGIINLILSIIEFFVFYEDSIGSRLIRIISTNITYHILYYFFSFMSYRRLKHLKKSKMLFYYGSYFFVLIGLIVMMILIGTAIRGDEPHAFFGMALPFGLLLGTLSFNNYMRGKKDGFIK